MASAASAICRARACLFAVLALASCGGSPTRTDELVTADLMVHPAGTFHVGHSSSCHSVFPDGAYLRWETGVLLEGVAAGRLDHVDVAIKSEAMGAVVSTWRWTSRHLIGRLGTDRLEPRRRTVIRLETIVGSCVPEDYTKHRFAVTVSGQITLKTGAVAHFTAGPVETGPARR